MDEEIKKAIKNGWQVWDKEKPWYCPKCKVLLSKEYFPSCTGGNHPYKPFFGVAPPTHEIIYADRSVTFEEYCTIMYEYYKSR